MFLWHCLFAVFCMISVTGCGSLTGIPGHGGGKRFAVEQELVAATTRATIKQIDVAPLRGKKINLFVNAIGDTGNGNLIGGRLSLVSQLRGDYIHSPQVVESSVYPHYTQSTTTSSKTSESSNTVAETVTEGVLSSSQSSISSASGATSSSGTSVTTTLLPSPERKQTRQKGGGGEVQVGVEYKGLGSYMNSEEISSDDLQYLSGLLQTYLFLSGVHVVPPSEAEVDVYVTVDVFGTIRTRVDWFLANNEILRAKTSLEVMAVDSLSGEVVMAPQSTGSEAEYNEQYILWAGPVSIRKWLRPTTSLLCDFTDLKDGAVWPEENVQDDAIPYPFRHEIGAWNRE